MRLTRNQILDAIGNNQKAIKGFGVRSLSLFGSCARAENTESSDLDFMVEFEKKSFDAYMDLKLFLEDLFGVPVDLVLANSIKPGLRASILTSTLTLIPT